MTWYALCNGSAGNGQFQVLFYQLFFAISSLCWNIAPLKMNHFLWPYLAYKFDTAIEQRAANWREK
jgi:hypothetical protein